jgi:hypothetical protein
MESIKIVTEVEVPINRVRDLLVCAFEGGSNYWAGVSYRKIREGLKPEDFLAGGSQQPTGGYYHWCQLMPTVEGCSVMVTDQEENEQWELDLRHLVNGLHLLAARYPHHWTDFIQENEDANTGDIYLQVCLFGEERYS